MTQKHHLTERGLNKIKRELEELRSERKEKTKGDVPDVFQSEDLNPEFFDFRQEMHFLEKKISELEEIIKNAKIIEPPEDKSKVALGARVIIEADGQKDEFILVGPLEAEPAEGKISDESPVGKKLIGKKEGDEVEVASKVKTIYKIKKIDY